MYIYRAIIFLRLISVGSSKHSIYALAAKSITFLLSSISFPHDFLKGLNKINYITVLLNNFALVYASGLPAHVSFLVISKQERMRLYKTRMGNNKPW